MGPVDIARFKAAGVVPSEASSFGCCHPGQAFRYTLIGNVNVSRERAQIVRAPVRRRTTATPFHVLPVQIATLAAAGGLDIIRLTLEPTQQRVRYSRSLVGCGILNSRWMQRIPGVAYISTEMRHSLQKNVLPCRNVRPEQSELSGGVIQEDQCSARRRMVKVGSRMSAAGLSTVNCIGENDRWHG